MPIDSVILSARELWTHPLHSEDDVLFPLLLHHYSPPNFRRSEPLCDMERWAGMGSGRKHWLPHGQNSDARFEPQFRCRFGSHLEGFLSLHSRPWLGTQSPQTVGARPYMAEMFRQYHIAHNRKGALWLVYGRMGSVRSDPLQALRILIWLLRVIGQALRIHLIEYIDTMYQLD